MSNSTSLLSAWIDAELARLEGQGLRRRLQTRASPQGTTIVLEGQELLSFGSNDYLGLAADPRIDAAACEAVKQYGWGSGASPLITGRSEAHQQLEEEIAEFEGTEAALVFSSGFAANAGTIAALVGPGDVVFADRKNHASLLDGCRLSRADVRVYPHNDAAALESLLKKSKEHRRRLIVTDTLFSMDGDFAPLKELADLAERHGAMLLADEAHATGVFGQQGRGLAEYFQVENKIPVRIGTLSKALGGLGGFVAGERRLIEWLVNRARTYIFSTAMPAAVAAAARAALRIVRTEPWRRQELLERAEKLRKELAAQGWNLGPGAEGSGFRVQDPESDIPHSQIIPLRVGAPEKATHLSAELRCRGLFLPAVRPPTVPEGESCLRISLTCAHTEAMIARLLEELFGLCKDYERSK
ncbi:MAG: 8-amino-7-oxononanoate synthase [Pirellulales bacterium]|nr:8-amino-7-oxononanoate synthase [Pirellulales bacterium]